MPEINSVSYYVIALDVMSFDEDHIGEKNQQNFYKNYPTPDFGVGSVPGISFAKNRSKPSNFMENFTNKNHHFLYVPGVSLLKKQFYFFGFGTCDFHVPGISLVKKRSKKERFFFFPVLLLLAGYGVSS